MMCYDYPVWDNHRGLACKTGMSERLFDPAELGAYLRERRKKLGYTQRDVADFNQCSLRFVSELERGKAGANLRQTLQIANSLGVDLILRERGDGSWH